MVTYVQAERIVSIGHSTLRMVHCERCDCEYGYELARVGVGRAIAPYGLGSGSLDDRATELSRQDLIERLETEAELVPCPKCQWINEELVAGYRLGRYRWVRKWALILGVGGTSACIVGGCVTVQGPPIHHHLLVPLLGLGPVISLAAALLLLGLRKFLRGRIRPNAKYPVPPDVPEGTPEALVWNSDRTQLAPVPRPGPDVDSEWQVLQIGRVRFPRRCLVCLADAEDETQDYELSLRDVVIKLPRCRSCATRADRLYTALSCGGMLLLTLLLPWLLSDGDRTQFWIVTVFVFVASLVVMPILTGLWLQPVSVRVVDRDRGVVALRFPNRRYRAEKIDTIRGETT